MTISDTSRDILRRALKDAHDFLELGDYTTAAAVLAASSTELLKSAPSPLYQVVLQWRNKGSANAFLNDKAVDDWQLTAPTYVSPLMTLPTGEPEAYAYAYESLNRIQLGRAAQWQTQITKHAPTPSDIDAGYIRDIIKLYKLPY